MESGSYFKKMRHTDGGDQPPDEDPTKTLIRGLGEQPEISIDRSIESAAKSLETDMASRSERISIVRTLVEAMKAFPEKCTIYTTLAGLLNARTYSFGEEIIDALVNDFEDSLRGEEWSSARLALRFISDLVNPHVVSATSLLKLYDSFLEAALDSNIPQVRRDWLLFIILEALPWVGKELYDRKGQTLERMLLTINNYMMKRRTAYETLLQVWSTDEHHPQEDYLTCIWAQIENLKIDGWTEGHINRPYWTLGSVLDESSHHSLPDIYLPPHKPTTSYPLPIVVFRMFDYTDCPEGRVLPGSHSIERYLIEEELKAILRKEHKDRRKCATALLAHPQGHRVPLEYMIVEVIFGELFMLPNPEFLQLCYGSLLLELCKQPGSCIPQVLAQATELLFDRLDTMNVGSIDRFTTWLAYHLSNNQFRWSWDDWAGVLRLDQLAPKARFVAEVIGECVRLSCRERIVTLVPANFDPLVPLPVEPCYKFYGEAAVKPPGQLQAKQLQEAFRDKASPELILVILRQLENQPTLAIQVFSETVFMLGSKSLTHASAAISKYSPIFKVLAKGEEAQQILLNSAHEVWKDGPQMLVVLVSLLLKSEIVGFEAVVNWIFGKEMEPEFRKMYVWEILHVVVRNVKRAGTRSAKIDSEGNKEEISEKVLEEYEARMDSVLPFILQKFVKVLSEHIATRFRDEKPVKTAWYDWTMARLQDMLMEHSDMIFSYDYVPKLEESVFTAGLDKRIREVFWNFKALKE